MDFVDGIREIKLDTYCTRNNELRVKLSLQRRKFFDSDVTELNGIVVACKSKITLSPVFSGMRRVRHELFDLTQVGIENQVAVQLDLDR